MSIAGKEDRANNAPLFAAAQLHLEPTANNRTALYGSTANTTIENMQTGIFNIDADEMARAAANNVAGPPHQGWVLRTEGEGGRAGRVQYEVLVALSNPGANTNNDILEA